MQKLSKSVTICNLLQIVYYHVFVDHSPQQGSRIRSVYVFYFLKDIRTYANVFYFSVCKQELYTLQLQRGILIKTVVKKVNSFLIVCHNSCIEPSSSFHHFATHLRASTRHVSYIG